MKKILIVDDDPRIRKAYKIALESLGYSVETAADGAEALDSITKSKPDLIILDIMMPKIHGINTLDIIKATPETTDITIIILSALSEDEMKKKAKSLKAKRYLVKSETSIADLAKTIEDSLKN